nr:hypothetical protein CFP56_43113 [Quercus suber]
MDEEALEPVILSSSSDSTPSTIATRENLLLLRPKVREGESLEARSNKLEYDLETIVIEDKTLLDYKEYKEDYLDS